MLPLRQPPLPPPPHHRHSNHHAPPSPAIFPFQTPPTRQATPSPAFQAFYTPPTTPYIGKTVRETSPVIILRDSHYRTSPAIWCMAIVCLVFSILLILFGILTVIVFAVIKPRYPTFDVPSANLNAVYFDSADYLNGDLSFVANFSNPNEKMDVKFEGVDLELAFSGRVIATRSLAHGFELRRKVGMMVGTVKMVSSLVYLPLKVAMELQQKVESNRVEYEVRGRFRVRAKIAGSLGYSYWLHATCIMEMTAPPTGVLIARRCTTKR